MGLIILGRHPYILGCMFWQMISSTSIMGLVILSLPILYMLAAMWKSEPGSEIMTILATAFILSGLVMFKLG